MNGSTYDITQQHPAEPGLWRKHSRQPCRHALVNTPNMKQAYLGAAQHGEADIRWGFHGMAEAEKKHGMTDSMGSRYEKKGGRCKHKANLRQGFCGMAEAKKMHGMTDNMGSRYEKKRWQM
eukprot:scaffold57337_cov16-Tisochrysis_lutea.AAC.1